MVQSTNEVTLPADFEADERGNVWLMTEDGTGHNIWIDLGNDCWLEIELRPENFPGLSVATLCLSCDELKRHIFTHCRGMWVRTLSLPGAERFWEQIPELEDE